MTTLHSTFGMEYAATPFMMRLGRREMLVTRDFCKRAYAVNPFIECDTGVEPGHVEILLFRRWLLILSKAHYTRTRHMACNFCVPLHSPPQPRYDLDS